MQHPAPAMVAMSLPARMRASLLAAWQQARPAQRKPTTFGLAPVGWLDASTFGMTGTLVDDQDHAKDAQQLYVVPAPGLVLGRLGRDSTTGTGPPPCQRQRQALSITRGSRGRKSPQRGR